MGSHCRAPQQTHPPQQSQQLITLMSTSKRSRGKEPILFHLQKRNPKDKQRSGKANPLITNPSSKTEINLFCHELSNTRTISKIFINNP